MPTRLDCGVTSQSWPQRESSAAASNQSARGPGTTSSTVTPAPGNVRLQFRDSRRRRNRRSHAGGQDLTGGQRCRADAGHGVRGPAAQHRGRRPRRRGRRGSCGNRSRARRWSGSRRPAGQTGWPSAPCALPDWSSSRPDARGRSTASHGEFRRRPGRRRGPGRPTAWTLSPPATDFDRGGRRRVAHEAVGAAQRGPVQRAGGGNPQAGVAVAAQVLDQALESGRRGSAGRTECLHRWLPALRNQQRRLRSAASRRPGQHGTAPGGPGAASAGCSRSEVPHVRRRCGRSAASRPGTSAGTRPSNCRPAPPNRRGRRSAVNSGAGLPAPGSPPPCSRSPARSRRRPLSRPAR